MPAPLRLWATEADAAAVSLQGEHVVVERMGEMRPVVTNGWFVALPLIDDIRFCVDMRERAIAIRPQSSITKDNVHVQVSGNLYCQFIDAEKAAYGSKNPIYAVCARPLAAWRRAVTPAASR